MKKKLSSYMLRTLAVCLMAVFCALALSGCAEKWAKDVDGTYVGDTFEIYPPQEWKYNEGKTNQVIFCTEDYPTDSASYISVGYTDEAQLEVTRKYKDDVQSGIISSLTEQLGDDCEAKILVFEDTTVNGFDCIHCTTSYLNEGVAFTQDQYTFDSSKGSVTVCFCQDSGEDFSADFKTALDSIVIK